MPTQDYSKNLKHFYSLLEEIAQYLPPEKLNQLFYTVRELVQIVNK